MKLGPWLLAPVALTLGSAASTALAVEPWADPDPGAPPSRLAISDIGFRGAAEYRAQLQYINPISLNGISDRRVGLIDHRLRLDAGIDYKDIVRLYTSVDALSGVLWGDNGTLGTDPEPTSGSTVDTRNVNSAHLCVAQRGANPLSPTSYGYGLCAGNDWFVRRAYGEVTTPIGLFRIGRQPYTEGTGTAVADGDGRTNRFGVSGVGNNVDGILFATKPLEAFVPKERRDTSETRGLFLLLRYDRLVIDQVRFFADNLHNVLEGLRFRAPTQGPGRDLDLRLVHNFRWNDSNGTAIHAVNAHAAASFGRFTAGFDATLIAGKTREVSAAYHVINNDPIVDQNVLQFGLRAVTRYDADMWTAYLELDYATGDDDPSTGSTLTQFVFAPDANVGLLLFKQVLAFQTARASAAGVALLKQLNAPSYPVTAVSTQGAFTNGIAIFPQFDFRPHRTVLLRGGVLVAWAESRAIDPVASLKAKDSSNLGDNIVNYVGGKPGRFYGVELDGRAQWRFMNHFAFDLEGAILFPGDALRDRNGDAVHSVLLQGRTTFFF